MKSKKLISAFLAAAMTLGTAAALPQENPVTSVIEASAAGTSAFESKKVTVNKAYTVTTKSAAISWGKVSGGDRLPCLQI